MSDETEKYEEELNVYDWPYDEEADDDLVHELMKDWDDIDDIDDYQYVDES